MFKLCEYKYCYQKFEVIRPDKKFCSKRCKINSRSSRRYEATKILKTPESQKCKNCGKKFKPNPQQEHCSIECRTQYKQQRYVEKHGKRIFHPQYQLECWLCGIEFLGFKKTQRYCCRDCAAESQRKYLDIPQCLAESHRKLDKNIGYVRIYAPMHPEANSRGYVYEHRVIAEQMLGRRLRKNEVVHHKNRKRWDNRKKNLQVMTRRQHARLHARTRESLL